MRSAFGSSVALVAAAVAGLVSLRAFAITTWTNTNGGYFDDGANWDSGQSPAYGSGNDASTQFSVSSFAGVPLCVAITNDFAADRLVMNAENRELDFDLGGKTLTLMARASHAMKFNTVGATVRFRNGTVAVDSGANNDNRCVCLAAADSPGSYGAFSNDTIIVDGAMFSPQTLSFKYGFDHRLVVTNGGSFVGKLAWGVSAGAIWTGARSGIIVAGDASSFTFPNGNAFGDAPGSILEVIGSPTLGNFGWSLGGSASGNRMTFRGGKYETANSLYCGHGSNSMSNRWELLDGAQITTADRLWLSYGNGNPAAGGQVFFLSGAGTSFKSTSGSVMHIGNFSGGNALEVSDGAFFSAKSIRVGTGSEPSSKSHGNSIYVHDGGVVDLFTTGNASSIEIGYANNSAATGNFVRVETQGVVTNGGFCYLGYKSGAKDNNLIVANGGCFVSKNALYVGYNEGSSGNEVVVTNGGTLSVNGNIAVGYKGHANRLLVENSTLDFSGQLIVGEAASSASNNVVVFRDVTNQTLKSLVRIGVAGVGGRLVAERSKLYDTDNTFQLGGDGENWFAGQGTVSLTDSYLLAKRFRAFGQDNVVALTNSVLDASPDVNDGGLYLPYQAAGSMTLLFAGTNAQARSGNALLVRSTATLRFSLPAGGYAHAALYTPKGKLTIEDGASFAFDDAGYGSADEPCPLFSAKSYDISDATLEAIRQALPDGMRLFLRDGVWYVKKPKGMMMILR